MQNKSRIRWSIFTLALGGALGLAGALMRGPAPLPMMDVDAWAAAVSAEGYLIAQLLTIMSYILPYFGFWALYAAIASQQQGEKLAFWGFMGSVIGTSLALPTLGIFSFISPVLAELYLAGNSTLPDIISEVAMGPPAAVVNISGGTIYLLGTVLLGVAMWRSVAMPKWTGVLLGAHGVLLVFGFGMYPVLLISWVCLLVAGLWVFAKFE